MVTPPVPLPATAPMTDLFTPLALGDLELPNRVIHAPLTRCRADDDHVPGPLIAKYYRCPLFTSEAAAEKRGGDLGLARDTNTTKKSNKKSRD